MTRYLLIEHEDPEATLEWSCLEPECGETVTDLERHTTQRHRSDHITVFTSKAALAAANFEAQQKIHAAELQRPEEPSHA